MLGSICRVIFAIAGIGRKGFPMTWWIKEGEAFEALKRSLGATETEELNFPERPESREIESVSGRRIRITKEDPIVAVFDLHGTLVESLWEEAFAETYKSLKFGVPYEEALEWVHENLFQGSGTEVVSILMRATHQPEAAVEKALASATAEMQKQNPTSI